MEAKNRTTLREDAHIMKLIFRGKHLTLEEPFRDYATKKLSRLARYVPLAEHAIVDVRREARGSGGRFVMQVTVNVDGTYLRAEERAEQLETAVDAVSDVLSRQVMRLKQKKLYRSERRVDKESLAVAAEAAEDAEGISGRVVKRKSFVVKPMTEAEAIEQMELLGHSFFLFRDGDREELALLYRRRDGDYGLILPESS
jgi:putative sigma-54 modulation protein